MIIMRGKECSVDPTMEARQEGACLLAGCLTKTAPLFCVVPQTMEQPRKAGRPGEEGNPTECNFTGGVALSCLLQACLLNHYYHQGWRRRPPTRRLSLKVPLDSAPHLRIDLKSISKKPPSGSVASSAYNRSNRRDTIEHQHTRHSE